ncbi:MAG: hypothetical protein ACRCVT_15950, partial [Leadbetterella sp.]
MDNSIRLIFLLFLLNETFAQTCFPEEKLPSNIKKLTNFGQRAEFSLDGNRVYFIDKPGGDVWYYDRKTQVTTAVTDSKKRPEGWGYYRVMVMYNGGLLLGLGNERHRLKFEFLDKNLKTLESIIREEFDEGPAVSRKTNKIAWTTPGQKEMYLGNITIKNSKVQIVNKKLILRSDQVKTVDGEVFNDILETQSFCGKNEGKLIFAQYVQGKAFRSEVMGVNLQSKEIINYSKSLLTYEEPEGIF